MINWNFTKEEHEITLAIAKRMEQIEADTGIQGDDRLTKIMDIEACHCNGNPLRLQELLESDDYDFCHDVYGIRRHINRSNGILENCFVPRYSQ